ncbi:P-loop containing nucleoside triphosphate hydrolase protein [Aspergillus cavernicola]|uniref:P-loop containing nucleoside triphosphate hydrolase protein n=1 Tax=Aspergillus cavernicola TaxID=176166 RepID=A0ABR4IDK8_9EURO
MQEDVHTPTLTVRETLRYAAALRLPISMNRRQRYTIVESVIASLDLAKCADTCIGDSTHGSGGSGGERRRLSVAIQMLSDPAILFCDEPTTGLDATTAVHLMQMLKSLVSQGATVVASLHSPRSEIWHLLDRVILMADGSVLYDGPCQDSIHYFSQQGHYLRAFANPAEFLIDLAAVDRRSREVETISRARVTALKTSWAARREKKSGSTSVTLYPSRAFHGILRQRKLGFWRQVSFLVARSSISTMRDPLGPLGAFLSAVFLALANGWIFFQLDGSLVGIHSRLGSLYIVVALNGYLSLLTEIYSMSSEIDVFDKERDDGVVSPLPYLLSRRVLHLFLVDIPAPLLFSIIYYFMVGYRKETGQILIFAMMSILTQVTATSSAIVFVSLMRSFAAASTVGNLLFTLQSFAAGYLIQVPQMPVYVSWLRWVTYSFYLFGALCANEFMGRGQEQYGQLYDCPVPGSGDSIQEQCKQYTGEFIMKILGFPQDWTLRPMLAALGFILISLVASAGFLHFRCPSRTPSKPPTHPSSIDADRENPHSQVAASLGHPPRVDIQLENYSVKLCPRRLRRPATRITLLHLLTITLLSGKLNVVMGPSGSGKSTLLESMSGRLHGSFSSRFEISGLIRYNGAIPLDRAGLPAISSMSQFGGSLSPILTVRETFQFASRLRLSRWMTDAEAEGRCNSAMEKTGLESCADSLVGSISGGQRRRLFIGLQLLTDSPILFLDEPTSGLDGFTALAIIALLQALATGGRTVVLTIHQPRSDMMQYFSTITLLTHGGNLVYSGSGHEILGYFESLGHHCPQQTSPTDYLLDLITVDTRRNWLRESTQFEVDNLIQKWREGITAATASERFTRPTEIQHRPSDPRFFPPARKPNFPLALRIYIKRSILMFRRYPDWTVCRLVQVVGAALLMVLFYALLRTDYEAIQTRLGFIQQFSNLLFAGLLQCIAIFPTQRDLFSNEMSDNCASVTAFLIHYTILDLPFEIITATVFGSLTSFAAGLGRTIPMFLTCIASAICLTNCGESMGIIFCSLFKTHTGFALSLCSVLIATSLHLGGIMNAQMTSPVLQAISYLSPFKYAVGTLAPHAFGGTHGQMSFTCSEGDVCPMATGAQVLALYSLDKNADAELGGLLVCTLVYRLIAYATLKLALDRPDLRQIVEMGRRWKLFPGSTDGVRGKE